MKRAFAATKSLAVTEFRSPLGKLRGYVSPRGLIGIDLPNKREVDPRTLVAADDRELPVGKSEGRCELVIAQLEEYFAGKRKSFDLPLAPFGGEFDRAVWREVAKVRYGKLATYGEIARAVGNPAACRAVGASNGRNHIPIVIPCHRIVGANHRLTGFGGGLELKAHMLEREGFSVSKGEIRATSRILMAE